VARFWESDPERFIETIKFDRPTSYNDFMTAVTNNNGRFYEEEGLNSYSYARTSRLP